MTAIGKTIPDWGSIHTSTLRDRWKRLDNTHNLVGRWHRDEGSVVLKRFASRPDYQRSLRILEAVNHLPIFPRLLGTARINKRPGLVFEDLPDAVWVVAQLMEGKEFLHLAAPVDRDRIASGLVTRLALLHAYGIVPNGMEFVDQFMIHRNTADVRWLDPEAYCLPGETPMFERNPLTNANCLTELGYPPGPPPAPMYERTAENRFVIPGTGRYVVLLGDVVGGRALPLSQTHHVEVIDHDPEQLHCIHLREDHPEDPSDRGSLTLAEGQWQGQIRFADYVEAYYPVTGTEHCWSGPDGYFDPARFLYGGLLNKIRVGGMATLISERGHFIDRWAETVSRDPDLELVETGFNRPVPLIGGYAAMVPNGNYANVSSWIVIRKAAELT